MQMSPNSFSMTDGPIDNDDDGREKIECLLRGGHGNQDESDSGNKHTTC